MSFAVSHLATHPAMCNNYRTDKGAERIVKTLRIGVSRDLLVTS